MADGRIITTKKSRPRLGHSAQAKWARLQQEKGNCRSCGDPRPPELKQLCRPCQTKVTAYMKRYRQAKKVKAQATAQPIPESTNLKENQ